MDTSSPKSATEDFDLLTRAHKGDALAARLLVMRLSPAAHRLAWRMLGDKALAEDVVQEALEKLFRIRQYHGDARLSTYFHTMVSRMCLDRCRALDPVRFDTDTMVDEPVDDDGPEQRVEHDQQASKVQRIMLALPPRQRMALSLWAYHDLSVVEIAEVLELERNATDQLLHRAKANMKKKLESDHHG
jgi:RNA polymerase sigma-70 factor (ECF subfamily)